VDLETGKDLWSQEIPAFRGMNILPPTIYADGVFTSAYGGKSMWVELKHDTKSEDQSKWETSVAWENRTQAYMSSPVVIGSNVYVHLRNQKFTCIDLETGETQWETDRKFGKYWSIVRQGDRLLALDQEGILFLIEASPDEFRLLDERKISDQETWAHLAVAGSEVIIRDQKGIAVYDWSSDVQLQTAP
jgi:outer membrane protein assembly factor BamB